MYYALLQYSEWHRIFLSVSMRPDGDTSRPLPILPLGGAE